MAKKYSKSALKHLAEAQFPLGISVDLRNLSEERFFTVVVACNNDSILHVKKAVNKLLNRECDFAETIRDATHSDIAFKGSGYEYEKICESGILTQILYCKDITQ